MTHPYAVTTAKQRIDQALLDLTIGMHLAQAFSDGRIGANVFATSLVIPIAGGAQLSVPRLEMSPDEFAKIARNTVLGVAKLSAVAAHSAWQLARKEGLTEQPEDAGALDILTEIRNAVAHDPSRPVWKIDRERKRVLGFTDHKGHRIEMDARHLRGKVLDPDHFGGWPALILLFRYAQHRIGQLPAPL